MSRKHPKVLEYGKKIDMSDLEADPMIMFQKRWVMWIQLRERKQKHKPNVCVCALSFEEIIQK